MRTPVIFFLSDFGTSDAYVGVVEAVIASVAPAARVVHLTHGVPPQDLRNASWQLFSAVPYLPDGSVVLAVVDPGVGSSRRPIVVEGARLTYVAPDNGLLEAALALDPARRAFALEAEALRRPTVSSTFHGRDVFGPAAAHLALGQPLESFGAPLALDALARLGIRPAASDRGEIWTFDRFGNAITTLTAPSSPPRALEVGSRRIPFGSHYAAAEVGEAIALVGSSGLIEIAVRDGSARERLALSVGERVAAA